MRAASLLVISGTLGGRRITAPAPIGEACLFSVLSVPLHQMCARTAIWRSVSEVFDVSAESG